MQNVNTLLQKLLNKFFPNIINFITTPASDWDEGGCTLISHNELGFEISGMNGSERGLYKYAPTIVSEVNGRTLKFAGSMNTTTAFNDGTAQPKMTIQMSNDGSTWTDLCSEIGNNIKTTNIKTFSQQVPIGDNYKYLRVELGYNVYQGHLCDYFRYKITQLEIE